MIENNEKVTLPIGLDIDGVRYREVIIDEMNGIDEENLASPKIKNNGAKAISILLRRCIQEVVGYVSRKTNRNLLLSEDIVKKMYAADREYLVMCIKGLSDSLEVALDIECTECGQESFHKLNLADLDVYEWDESEPKLEVELPRGFYNQKQGTYHNKLVWKLPNGSIQEKLGGVKQNELASYMMASGIVSVEGMQFTPGLEEVRSLSLTDRNAFASAIVENSVGVDTTMNLECPYCGSQFERSVDIMGFFNSGEGQKKKTTSVGKTGRRKRKRT